MNISIDIAHKDMYIANMSLIVADVMPMQGCALTLARVDEDYNDKFRIRRTTRGIYLQYYL